MTEKEVDEEIKRPGRLRLCSSSLNKCKVEEDSQWIIPGHFQSQSEVSRVGSKRIHCARHSSWKAVVDDKQVSWKLIRVQGEKKSEGEKEMLGLWRRTGGQARKEKRCGQVAIFLMGYLSWDLASASSRGIRRKMGNQEVSEVRCQSISLSHFPTQKIDGIEREKEEDFLNSMGKRHPEMCFLCWWST